MPTTPSDPFPPFTNDSIAWLADWCPRCVNRCVRRVDALTAPDAVSWQRGREHLVCAYECASCGTTWERADLYRVTDIGAVIAPADTRMAA